MSVVVLLSGGLDSAICLELAPRPVVALAIDYGQPHAASELPRARQIATRAGVELVEACVRIRAVSATQGDPAMYWPGRNLMLLSLAAALAQTRGLKGVVIGANRDDRDGYPDCRAEFFVASAPALGVRVIAPLLELTKPEVGQLARKLRLPVEMTWSCYYPTGSEACGACDACTGRARALG